MRVLYLTYTGLLEPLGRSQVLSYLKKLALSYEITVISFEKRRDLNDKEAFRNVVYECRSRGIHWYPLVYHQHPRLIATLYDLGLFSLVSSIIVVRGRIKVVHSRSLIPGVIGFGLKRILAVRLIYDMRGFWTEERVSAGSVKRGSRLFKTLSRLERQCFIDADHLVSLTHAAIEQLPLTVADRRVPVSVIPTCADLDFFRPLHQCPSKENQERFVLGCAGTVMNHWFDFGAVCRFFCELRRVRQDALLRVVSRDDETAIREFASKYGVGANDIEIRSRHHSDMPEEIRQFDAGVFFYRAGPAESARCPTRMAELLGCGVACVVNAGIGDVALIVNRYNVGVVVEQLTDSELAAGVSSLLNLISDKALRLRCRKTAESWFSLSQGVAAYDEIYRSLEMSVGEEESLEDAGKF